MSNEMPPPPPPIFDGANVSPTGANDSTWIAVAHFGTLISIILFPGILVPLIVMLTEGKKSANVRAHAVESLNFQISMFIYGAISTLFVLFFIGIITGLVAAGFALVCPIIAGIKASNGGFFKYPLTIRMVK